LSVKFLEKSVRISTYLRLTLKSLEPSDKISKDIWLTLESLEECVTFSGKRKKGGNDNKK
jgi:hypothetical protein